MKAQDRVGRKPKRRSTIEDVFFLILGKKNSVIIINVDLVSRNPQNIF